MVSNIIKDMNKIDSIKQRLLGKDAGFWFVYYFLDKTKFDHLLPDKLYLQLKFRCLMGKKLNLDHPQTFNEKLQWLKLYNRNPLYPSMVDKSKVKSIVSKIIGEQYIIPTIGVWDKFDDIDFNELPNSFVLKTTHSGSSSGVVVCKDKASLNFDKAKKIINESLHENSYWGGREWPYKSVKPRILVEQYITPPPTSSSLIDYKFYCFNGKPYKVLCCLDRESGNTQFYSFDKDWVFLRHDRIGMAVMEGFTLPKPPNIRLMFCLAEKLAKDMPFVRIDMYNVQGIIYFGEITFYPNSGFNSNLLPNIDLLYGSMVHLPEKK